jgi:hypothetical protein
MSVIKFPKWAIEIINFHMANFFWMIRKISTDIIWLTRKVCAKKRAGRLGVPDLRELNMCLLASWVQRYYDSESKLWREITDCKYNIDPNIFCCVDRNASPFLERGSLGS